MLIYIYQTKRTANAIQNKEVGEGGTNMHIIIAFILYALFTTKQSSKSQDSKSNQGYDRAVWLSHSFSRDDNYKRY